MEEWTLANSLSVGVGLRRIGSNISVGKAPKNPIKGGDHNNPENFELSLRKTLNPKLPKGSLMRPVSDQKPTWRL